MPGVALHSFTVDCRCVSHVDDDEMLLGTSVDDDGCDDVGTATLDTS